MSYVDDDTPRRSRHRARHTDAAPDPSRTDPDPWDGDGTWADPPIRDAVPAHGGPAHGVAVDTVPVDGGPPDADVPDADVTEQPGRAGRNLPAAVGVSTALGALVIASLLLWKPAFLGVVAVAIVVGTWEMVRAIRPSGVRPPLVPLLAGGLTMAGLAWQGGAAALPLGLVATVVAVLVWRLADGAPGYQGDVTTAVLVAMYVAFLGSFTILLVRPDDGVWRVLATLAAVSISDTGGYVTGVFLGRRRMAPSVSPGKTWEGLAGSLVWSAVGGSLLLYFLLDVAWWGGALFGLAVSGAAVLGDLAESLLKRDLGVKDMSNLLPGHGGLMDRLDSILLAAPTAYALLAFLAPPGGP